MQQSKYDAQTVIDAGHPPVAKGIVCVDFDGTIFPFGNMYGNEPPIPGAAEAVRSLADAGYTVVVFSSRFSKAWHEHEGWDHDSALAEQTQFVMDRLAEWNIPYDRLTAEKIPAQAYFDDKAYRAEGDYGLARAASIFLFKESERVRS